MNGLAQKKGDWLNEERYATLYGYGYVYGNQVIRTLFIRSFSRDSIVARGRAFFVDSRFRPFRAGILAGDKKRAISFIIIGYVTHEAGSVMTERYKVW